MKLFIISLFTTYMLLTSCQAEENNTPKTEESIVENSSEEIAQNSSQNYEEELKENKEPKANKKEFEGYIKYHLKVESGDENFSTDKVTQSWGDTLIIYHSKGRYKMKYNGMDLDAITYTPEENAQYTSRKSVDTIYKVDCRYESSVLYSKLKKDTDQKAQGRDLQFIQIYTNKLKIQYYYDSTLYINPERYSKHTFGHMADYYQMAESPYIYAVLDYPNFRVKMDLIEIVEKQLNDSIFAIPKDRPITNLDMNKQR